MGETATKRRLNLADGLILIALSASAMLVQRQLWAEIRGSTLIHSRFAPVRWLDWLLGLATTFLTPLAAFGTVGVGFLRLRRPRPDLRQLWRRPGPQAVLSTMAEVLALTLLFPWLRLAIYLYLPGVLGPTVALVWTIRRLRLAREPDGDWIDRSGTVLGWYWIVIGVGLFWGVWILEAGGWWLFPASAPAASPAPAASVRL